MNKQLMIPEGMTPEPLPCPFCGGKPKYFYMDQGYKWGGVQCCIAGPDVRTSYDESEDAPWHTDAIEIWNTREPGADDGDEDV